MSKLAFLLFSICCFFCGFASTKDSVTFKIKVNLSEISFREDGMYYLLENGRKIKILNLSHKEDTYYADLAEDVFGIWWCYKCQRYNSRFQYNCSNCGRPKEVPIEEIPVEDLYPDRDSDLDRD